MSLWAFNTFLTAGCGSRRTNRGGLWCSCLLDGEETDCACDAADPLTAGINDRHAEQQTTHATSGGRGDRQAHGKQTGKVQVLRRPKCSALLRSTLAARSGRGRSPALCFPLPFFPFSPFRLPSHSSFSVSGLKITALPDDIGRLVNLQRLDGWCLAFFPFLFSLPSIVFLSLQQSADRPP